MKSLLVFLGLLYCVAYIQCSSHSEAPNTAARTVADITDLYVFDSYETGRSGFFTVLLNVYPLQAPFGGPNYFTLSDQHFYEVNIDTDGDCVENAIIQFYFGNALGGSPGTLNVPGETDQCNIANPVGNVTTKAGNTGITIPINGVNVAIPLKYAGQITSTNPTANSNWAETYFVNYLNGSRTSNVAGSISNVNGGGTSFTKPFDYVGTKTMPDYAAYAATFIYNINIPGCATAGKIFVGQRAESFAVNLGPIFDLVNFDPTSITNCTQNNALTGYNVHTLALELPISCFATATNRGVLGVWSTVRELFHDVSSQHVAKAQVSRLGNPLVNEVVIGLKDKAIFNAYEPTQDAYFATYVTNPTLPSLVEISLGLVGKLAPTNFPRTDLEVIYLEGIPTINQFPTFEVCEYIRLNTSIPPTPYGSQSNFGILGGDLAGYPNGRRPGDDAIDISLRAILGAACLTASASAFGCTAASVTNPAAAGIVGDGAPQNQFQFDVTFPYLRTPYPGADGSNKCAAVSGSTGAGSTGPTKPSGGGSSASSLNMALFDLIYFLFQ